MADARDALMERLLRDAGLAPGQRVLDLGCGQGEVSLMAARLVGPTGRVLGLDREAEPLDQARRRVEKLGFTNLDFAQADLDAPPAEQGRFDAIIGRRVLMYLADPGLTLRRLLPALQPGGLVVFQEHDATGLARERPVLPLHQRCQALIWETVRREGANVHLGLELHPLLSAAGLWVEGVRVELAVALPEEPYPLAQIIRAMLPRIVGQGLARAEELDLDHLEQRLRQEQAEANAVFLGDLVCGVWARKPA